MPKDDPAGYLPNVQKARKKLPPSAHSKRMQKAAKSRMKKMKSKIPY